MFWFCVVFCLVLLVFCQRVHENCWRLTFTKYKTICLDAIRSLELWMCLDVFALISADWNWNPPFSDAAMLPVSFPSQELLPANSTFRSAMPYILCTESSKLKFGVDFIGHACVFGYAVVIPSFILYLYSRQRVVLRSSRIMTAAATFQQGDLKVCLHEIQSSTTETKWLQDAVLFSTFAKVVIFCHSNVP